jgi:Holliday junction resolvase-like predicted endonuclease
MAQHNERGKIGEDLAYMWLKNQGFSIIERNFSRKWGEIDIIARKQILHFIEVKTVSYETRVELERAVSHGTYRPEENVHRDKQHRLSHAIESWLLHREEDFQIDIMSLRLVPREKYARVELIENVIFDC